MTGVDPGAAGRFLETAFERRDWVAIFLKSYDRSGVAQRVGPMSSVQSERFQRWLRALNSRKYNVFVSVNAIASGRRSRTRDAIGAVRHLFLDADHDGSAVLSRLEARQDLPSPSYVLHSSPNRVHVFWRVRDFDGDSVERLQKQLARELQTDPAATPVTQNTRLPGFFYLKSPVARTRGTSLVSQRVRYAAVTDTRADEATPLWRPRGSSFSPSASSLVGRITVVAVNGGSLSVCVSRTALAPVSAGH